MAYSKRYLEFQAHSDGMGLGKISGVHILIEQAELELWKACRFIWPGQCSFSTYSRAVVSYCSTHLGQLYYQLSGVIVELFLKYFILLVGVLQCNIRVCPIYDQGLEALELS